MHAVVGSHRVRR
uniref:Uncharacterized protein n=1 Tax=Anguilla anguilla TaxID=7936 RepID=A0A0E9PRE8_ANGAN